jgi:hypothetical protein
MTLIYGRDPAIYTGKDEETGGQQGQESKGAGGMLAPDQGVPA